MALSLAAGVLPASLEAQAGAGATLEVARDENLRAAPNGEVIARLSAGTRLSRIGERGNWVEIELDAWVWARSLQVVDRGGFDLVVTPASGENLRAGPGSEVVVGRAGRGMLLVERERVPGWIRASRRAWIWGESVRQVAGAATDAARGAGTAAAGGGEGTRSSASASAPASGSASAPSAATESPPASTTAVEGSLRLPTAGVALRGAPAGDTLVALPGGLELGFVERRDGWARVRLEGWIPLTEVDDPQAEPVVADRTPDEVVNDPARWRGRTVTWPLEFVALEVADATRPDFRDGESYLLTRFIGPRGARFVYVAVPQGQVERVRGLVPLERISVTGRIRVGATARTGHPLLDLIELERAGR